MNKRKYKYLIVESKSGDKWIEKLSSNGKFFVNVGYKYKEEGSNWYIDFYKLDKKYKPVYKTSVKFLDQHNYIKQYHTYEEMLIDIPELILL